MHRRTRDPIRLDEHVCSGQEKVIESTFESAADRERTGGQWFMHTIYGKERASHQF